MHILSRVVSVAATLVLAAAPVLVAGPAAASASYKLHYIQQPNGNNIIHAVEPVPGAYLQAEPGCGTRPRPVGETTTRRPSSRASW